MVAEKRRGLRIGLCAVCCVLIIIGLAGLIVFLVLYFDKSSSDQSVTDEIEYIYKDLNIKSIFNLATGEFINFREIWGYQCNQSKCIRTKGPRDHLRSLDLCALTCLPKGPIWPQPTGYVNISQNIEYIDWTQTTFQYIPGDESLDQYWKESIERFLKIMQTKFSKYGDPIYDGKALKIIIDILHKSLDLTIDTNENYKLLVEMKTDRKNIVAYISADNYFGARHGLETLSYLIVHDEWTNKIFIPQNVIIADGPTLKYRGVLIDTSRNYFYPSVLKRTIDVMAITKLNTFHWHLIDIQSFPLILSSYPNLADGAYSKDKTYNAKDIKNIIDYARIRGIRVIPEFDSPSRVGEGWQTTNLTICFNGKFLCEDNGNKICGQFDVTNEIVYSTLNSIYEEMFTLFGNPEFFHMGGAEVSYECWNSSKKIQSWMIQKGFSLNNKGFLQLWALFETSIIKRFLANNRKIILWQNRLNKSNYFKYKFDKNNILIQIIDNKNGEVKYYLEKGFQVILSLVDLEKPWLDIYQSNELISNYKKKDQIIGMEICLWSHSVDEYTIDGKLWPKVSAFGESLWTNPKIDFYEVGLRISLHRNFLTLYGIAADAIGTEWCSKNINAKVCYCS